MIKKSISWLIVALVAILAAFALWPNANQSAPQTNYVLLDGTSIDEQSFQGKVTLVNFWATSCVTCVAEMPDIVAAYEAFNSKGFEVLAVAMSYDPPVYVLRFTEQYKLPFQVALDNTGRNAKAWGDVNLTPTTFIVDKQGKIVKSFVGSPNFDELHVLIEKLLVS